MLLYYVSPHPFHFYFQEELDKQLLDVQPTPVVLPDAPSTDLPTASKAKPAKADHDKDLEDLEMWANA